MTRSLPMVAGWVTAAVATVIAILAGGYIPTDPATLPESLLGAALFGPGELPQVTRAIVAALVLGPYAWLLYKNRVVAIPSVRIMGAVGVLGLCLVAASLMSPYRYPALVSLAQWLVALGGLVALVALMGRGQGPPFLLAAITVAGGLLALRGIMEYSAMKSIDPNWRIFGGYQNPNALAGVLAACVPVSVGLTSTLKRPINIMAAAWTLVLVMGVVLTQSRGGFLAMGVGLAVAAIVLAFQKDFRRAIGWIVPLLLAVALTVSLSNRDFGSGAPGAPGGRLANVQSTEAQSSGFRQNLWRSSAELIAQKPLGRGLGSFRYEVGKPGLVTQTVHAHQTYLQLAVEGGVLALLALLAVAWFWLRDTLKNAKSLTDERRLRLVGVVGGVSMPMATCTITRDASHPPATVKSPISYSPSISSLAPAIFALLQTPMPSIQVWTNPRRKPTPWPPSTAPSTWTRTT
jgi:O-antigen ligase